VYEPDETPVKFIATPWNPEFVQFWHDF